MESERPARLRLLDILNAIQEVETHVRGKSFSDYAESTLLQRAVERWLEIISEASRHIPPEWKEENPSVPWKAMADFGNWTRHAYQSISAIRVWETATGELAALKAVCERYYSKVKQPADPWPDAQSK
jgi:uncharacterized protein with HEPN domain